MAIKTMRPNGPWCTWPGTALAPGMACGTLGNTH